MKIIAIGRNYSEHIHELKNNVPEKPVFFMKPETALLQSGRAFYIPDFSENVHYEVEIVLKISKLGKSISKKFAHKYFHEIGVGIDFTARDLQKDCKEKGLPWEIAKSFDNSAPVSSFVDVSEFQDINNLGFSLKRNDHVVQRGNTSQMIFSFDEIISYVSQFVTLKIGDLIFTGTPAGVGKIEIGDELSASIENKVILQVKIK